ncbi:MAG TPA: branched-chain amino acid ABC transporter permease [Chitinivibrionales bacterium]|nr:branched-chain amino acid ABC transporter permease [Chitinivibrionales bacterium]
MANLKRYLPLLIIAALVAGIQLLVTLTGHKFYLTQLTMSAYYTIVVIGLCMLMGYAGQISLGHAGFFAIGGYVSAALTTADFYPLTKGAIGRLMVHIGWISVGKDVYGADIGHLTPWLAFFAAIIATVIIAYLIGIPVLRLKGHYLAMATLGFGSIIYKIVLGTKVFGCADGIANVPAFGLTHGLNVSGNMGARISNYYIAWFLVLLAALLMHNLVHSRAGRALRSIHGNEEAAAAMGVDVARYKLTLFVISAVFASVAGIFLTHYNGGIGPSEASIMKSVRYVAIVAVGGMSNLWGAILASVTLNFLSLRGYFGSFDEAVFGGILVLVMLFAPNGILVKTGVFKNIGSVIRKIHRGDTESTEKSKTGFPLSRK